MDAVVHQTVKRCGSARCRSPDRRWPGACMGISIKHARGWRAVGTWPVVTHRQPRPPAAALRQTGIRTAAVQQPRVDAQAWCGKRTPAPPFSAAAAPTLRRAASASSHAASTSSQSAPVHVGAPAGANAASITPDHVAGRTATFAAAAAPTSHPGPCRYRPGRVDIVPIRTGSCRSAGRREGGVDYPRPRRRPHAFIRGCRLSYIPPWAVSGCAGAPGRRGSSSITARATSGRRRPWFIAVCRIRR